MYNILRMSWHLDPQSPFPNDNKKVLTMDNPTENISNWKALPMLKTILIIFMSFKNAPVGKGA